MEYGLDIRGAEGNSALIAIVGRPNVGKSSILNRLLGQKVAIVSRKPQTTRTRIMGVLTVEEDQMVFMDTPGLLKPRNPLGDYMVKSVTSTVAGVDACLLVTEAGAPVSKADEDLPDKERLMGQIAAYSGLYDFRAVVPVSARDGNGMDGLLAELRGLTVPGGWLFDEDMVTDQPEQVIAAELVREKVLRLLDQEVPHGVAAVTEHMEEEGETLTLHVTLYCEKQSHKGILIGKGGQMLKKIGTLARVDLEKFFGCRINLQLWVKVKEDWRQRPQTLQGFGFSEQNLEM